VGLDTSFELRRNLGALGPGRLQGLAFFDYATVNINAYPWPGAGNNSAQLAGAGVGLNWSTARNMRVKCSLATPLGGAPDSVSSTSKLRAWLELSAMF
jgi:hemolysin activation/secretion protein